MIDEDSYEYQVYMQRSGSIRIKEFRLFEPFVILNIGEMINEYDAILLYGMRIADNKILVIFEDSIYIIPQYDWVVKRIINVKEV
jgi:hypothetical protein